MNAIDKLILTLGDENPAFRRAAAEDLRKAGEGVLASAVIDALENREQGREQLARLAEGGDRRAFKPLERRVEDDSWTVRRGACTGLGRLGDMRALDLLARMLKPGFVSCNPMLDREWGLRKAIGDSLVELHRVSERRHPEGTYICSTDLKRFRRAPATASSILDGTYMACPACRGTGTGVSFGARTVFVAELNADSSKQIVTQGDDLRMNWLFYRRLFDFDRLEIVLAEPHDVDMFLGQLKADPELEGRCRQMVCVVTRGCALSTNNKTGLERMFGKIEFGK